MNLAKARDDSCIAVSLNKSQFLWQLRIDPKCRNVMTVLAIEEWPEGKAASAIYKFIEPQIYRCPRLCSCV